MVFGFGTGGIDATSKWSIRGDGNSLIESDNFYFNHTFSGSATFTNSCFGGGKFNWGCFAGNVFGGLATLGAALLLRNKGGNCGFGGGAGIFGGGLGAGGLGAGGSIWGGGLGTGGLSNDIYGMGSYGTGYIDPASNPYAITLPKTPIVEGGSKTGKGSGTDDDANNGNGNGLGDTNKGKGSGTGNGVDDTNKGKGSGTGNGVDDTNNGNGNGTAKTKQGGGAEGGASKTTKKTPVSEGEGTPTGSYLRALIDGGKVDGKEYDGQAAGKVDTKGIGVKSLKESEDARKEWGDTKANGTTSTRKDNDYKDAVKLGKAKGDGIDEMAGTNNDYPKYFTITDRTSHNEYTFEFSSLNNGVLKYKFVKDASDLSKDDTDNYNGMNWEPYSNGTEYVVTIKNGEIVLDNQTTIIATNTKK